MTYVQSCILSDIAIQEAMSSGDLVIEPFDEINLGSDTYDVRLGEWFYRESPSPHCIAGSPMFNPFSKGSVRNVWGEPLLAERVGDRCNDDRWSGWKEDDRFILLHPGETILGHTVEFIGGVRSYTTKMFSRSTVGRCMLGVCKCAGRGDVGYFNRWTMEITSFSSHNCIPLKVGMRIAQIEFLPVGSVSKVYGRDKGKYQSGTDLASLVANWKPELMLPRLYKDCEVTE